MKKDENDWIVVIPSYNRVEGLKNMTLHTLKNLGIEWNRIYLFVANLEEKKKYMQEIKEGEDVKEIIVGEKGLVNVRNFIFRYFPVGQRLLSFDDDVRGFLQLKGNKLRPVNGDEFRNMVKVAFEECEKGGARLWGDYPVKNAFFMENSISYDFKFIIGSFWGCINPGASIKIPFGTGQKEDYQRTILFWEKDRAIIRLNYLTHITATYGESGGLQSDGIGARVEMEKKVVSEMVEKWPEFVSINPRRKGVFPEILLRRQPFAGERKMIIGRRRTHKKLT